MCKTFNEQVYPLPKVHGRQDVVESIPFCGLWMQYPFKHAYNKCCNLSFGLEQNSLFGYLCCMGMRLRCTFLVQIKYQQCSLLTLFCNKHFPILLLSILIMTLCRINIYHHPWYNHLSLLISYPCCPSGYSLLNDVIVRAWEREVPWWKKSIGATNNKNE